MNKMFKKLLTLLLIFNMLFVNLLPTAVYAEDLIVSQDSTNNSVSNTGGDVSVTTGEPTPTTGNGETSTNTATVDTQTTPEPTSTQPEPTTTQPTSTEQQTQVVPTPTLTTAQISADDNDEAEDIAADLARQQRVEARRAERQASGYKEEGDANRATSETSAAVVGVNTNSGSNDIKTGDATTNGAIVTNANNNLSAGPVISGTNGGATIANTGNGFGSNNNGSATLGNTNNTNQDNLANVNNGLNLATSTGSNDSSKNTGGDSSIKTGDANTTGTVVTAVNTNVDGIMVSEFNVTDDHMGDIILDFGANCVSGCGTGSTNIANTGNGSNSDNSGSVDSTTENNTFQNNEANIGSELVLSADSGNNRASKNTNGDSSITTGDANVAANVLTFANNNIAGDVVYGVVNIFGDLVGDILFPESAMTNCCGTGDTTVTNSGNGSDSTNTGTVSSNVTDNVFQQNDADITNTLVFDAQTGENSASNNTGGDSSITTGDTNVDANILNIVNNNLIGGNMWLVLVNEAGNWIGKIIGAPEGQNFAGSQGSEFNVDENGYITVTNSGNGSGSTNSGDVNQSTTNNTTQINDANINNTLNLSANTGGNTTDSNTGGNSSIKTGDANIVANLVNFVNNNIVGDGKLFVTVVNVFGSWIGDFVSPGTKKEVKTNTTAEQNNTNNNLHVGGQQNTASNNSNKQSETKTVKTEVESTNNNEAVAAAATNNNNFIAYAGVSNTDNSANKEGKTLVKSASVKNTSVLGNTSTKKKITINLAWILIALPLLASTYAAKRLSRRRVI